MTVQATPGHFYYNPALDQIRDSQDRVVAHVHVGLNRLDEQEANGYLMAAAPTLQRALDACETILSPNMLDHRCRVTRSPKRCGECINCATWAAWTFAKSALDHAKPPAEAVP